jgi:hypothetical protein
MYELVVIHCAECGDPVGDMPPDNYLVPGSPPDYRHVADRTALCP